MAHAIQISGAHLKRAHESISRLQSRLGNVSKKTEHVFETGMSAALTVGTAAAFGFTHGRHGPVKVLGMPLELGVGVAALGASLAGVGGKWKRQLGAVGDGALSVYAYNMAKGAGTNLKAKALAGGAAPKPSTVTGALPSDRLTAEEQAVLNRPIAVERG
jgi:hypothetical protein